MSISRNYVHVGVFLLIGVFIVGFVVHTNKQLTETGTVLNSLLALQASNSKQHDVQEQLQTNDVLSQHLEENEFEVQTNKQLEDIGTVLSQILAFQANYSKQNDLSEQLSSNEDQSQDSVQKQNLEMHDIREFFEYVETPIMTCNHSKEFGGVGKRVRDGEKVVCLDPEYNITPGNCTVYSFGISNEWSFDDEMANFGCNVYAFDPSMGAKSHQRGERISFYDIGIGGQDGIVTIKKKQCQVKRFTNIMKMLGHEDGVVIDYLKMDVEGAEIPFLEDVLQNTPDVLQRIKQIGMEIHPGEYSPDRIDIFKQNYRLFKQLENHGFRLFSSKWNPWKFNIFYLEELGRKVNGYYELVWSQRKFW